ncbi:hypothetical protein [Streptomyces lasiicapitis]|uniref:Uncharacterized protein n=1 Tax=Streptomyces lasiicapitis TaxID=1923961 RepID=A0ABQ2MVU4_9ACTN|nr:hypothetical protein [Streptomyces lasiicapitis]GGO58932.1 hypothetical protein GCM10012286_79370 [Streptomyces lasiicapitis]
MTLHTATWGPGGGVDLTIRLTGAEVDAIGLTEAEGLVEHMDTALWALAILRTGHSVRTEAQTEITADDLHIAIRELHTHLVPMVGGIRDAAIRRHRELGGTTGQLAAAMDSQRSSAQRRREALDETGPRRIAAARWEAWASAKRSDDTTDQD